MTYFINYVLAAMIAWYPISNHTFYEKVEITTARYLSIATTIAQASIDPKREPLFAGPDGRVKEALLLASVAASESGFRDDVDTCKRNGDGGLAFTLWQLHAKKDVVCANREAGAGVALDIMRTSFTMCKSFELVDRMSGYTDGTCHANWQRSRYKMVRAINWYAAHKPESIVIEVEEQHE